MPRSDNASGRFAPPTLFDEKVRGGYLRVILAAACWSTSGILIRIIVQHYGLSTWTLAFWRDLIAFAIFFTIVAASGFVRLRVARRDLLMLGVLGVLSPGLSYLLWTQAVVMIPIAVATVLNYTSPLFVVLWVWLFWRERPSQRQAMALVSAFLGILLITGAYNFTDAHLNAWGILIAVCSGATSASFTVLGKRILERYERWTVLTYAFGFATLTVFLLQPSALWQMSSIPPSAWLTIVALTLISTIGGFGFYSSGLKRLAAGSASITATAEPVIAAVLAFVLLGELIAPIQMPGSVLIIGAVILLVGKTQEEQV